MERLEFSAAPTSNGGAIPEIVGDAAGLVDPKNIPAFSAMLQRVLTDEEWCEELRKKGFKRVKKFTWRKTALKHLDVP